MVIFLGLQEVLYWNEMPILRENICRLLNQYRPDAQNHAAYEKARDEFYKNTIRSKEDFRKRIDYYKKNGKPVWVSGRNEYFNEISPEQMEKAFRYVRKERGRELAERPRGKWAELYAEKVLGNTPQKILELTVGAGGGTGAVAGKMREQDTMIGVDIDFVCAKNADSIGRYYDVNLLGLCCNLWQLPFPDESFSVICCQNGLVECREVPTILMEAVRVLMPGGKMVMTMGANGYKSYRNLFELFEIDEEEGLMYLRDARLYSTPDEIDNILKPLGIIKSDDRLLENGGHLVEFIKQ